MAMDPSLREMFEAYKVGIDNAAKELKAVYEQFEGQKKLLEEFLGQGLPEVKQQLENIASKGADAIPDGLRQEVLDAYNHLAQIIADAPDELKPSVDPDGVQAARAVLTAQASQLMGSGGVATGGVAAAVAAWWASLSTVAAVAVVAAGILLLGGGLYFGYKAMWGSGQSPSSASGPARDPSHHQIQASDETVRNAGSHGAQAGVGNLITDPETLALIGLWGDCKRDWRSNAPFEPAIPDGPLGPSPAHGPFLRPISNGLSRCGCAR